jgi:hypothetical protein
LFVAISACATARAADFCDTSIDFPDSVLAAHIVMFGEVHGTAETPALVGDFVCQLAARGDPVLVGLEISAEEQGHIDAYLVSDDSETAEQELVKSAFWSGQDGRSSTAMRDLLVRLRQLRGAGRDLVVVALDAPGQGTRDAAMSGRLREWIRQAPHKKVAVLVGNLHALRSKGSPFDPAFEPMGFYLADLAPLSLFVDFVGGSAWNCQGGCAAHALHPKPAESQKPPGVYIDASLAEGYDGLVVLSAATPSRPARSLVQ